MLDRLQSHLLHWSLDFAGSGWVDRFRASLAEAPDLNEALLARILQENQDTVYGRQHGFASIHDPRELSRRVPLTDFESYRAFVERIADGEPNVLTKEPVRYLGVTSGTTGRGKLVPVTKSAQSAIIAHMMLTPAGVQAQRFPAREPGPGVLMLSSTLPETSKGGIPIGTATATGMDRRKGVAELFWSSPLPITRVRGGPRGHRAPAVAVLTRVEHLELVRARTLSVDSRSGSRTVQSERSRGPRRHRSESVSWRALDFARAERGTSSDHSSELVEALHRV